MIVSVKLPGGKVAKHEGDRLVLKVSKAKDDADSLIVGMLEAKSVTVLKRYPKGKWKSAEIRGRRGT